MIERFHCPKCRSKEFRISPEVLGGYYAPYLAPQGIRLDHYGLIQSWDDGTPVCDVDLEFYLLANMEQHTFSCARCGAEVTP
jgi:hypothetical protein